MKKLLERLVIIFLLGIFASGVLAISEEIWPGLTEYIVGTTIGIGISLWLMIQYAHQQVVKTINFVLLSNGGGMLLRAPIDIRGPTKLINTSSSCLCRESSAKIRISEDKVKSLPIIIIKSGPVRPVLESSMDSFLSKQRLKYLTNDQLLYCILNLQGPEARFALNELNQRLNGEDNGTRYLRSWQAYDDT